jgi:hypothetical protein
MVDIEIRDCLIAKVRREYEGIGTMTAGQRVTGTSYKDLRSGASDDDVITCPTVKYLMDVVSAMNGRVGSPT